MSVDRNGYLDRTGFRRHGPRVGQALPAADIGSQPTAETARPPGAPRRFLGHFPSFKCPDRIFVDLHPGRPASCLPAAPEAQRAETSLAWVGAQRRPRKPGPPTASESPNRGETNSPPSRDPGPKSGPEPSRKWTGPDFSRSAPGSTAAPNARNLTSAGCLAPMGLSNPALGIPAILGLRSAPTQARAVSARWASRAMPPIPPPSP
jgi:hypothetical protein